jgi:hypothetical protein
MGGGGVQKFPKIIFFDDFFYFSEGYLVEFFGTLIARSSTKMIAVNYQNYSCQLHYLKRERYYISTLCFKMARQMTLSTELS